RKYYLIQQPKTWNDSQVYCRANHEDLAVIESVENVIRFQSDMKKQNFTSSAWIGLYSDVNNWRWSLGNEPVGSSKLWAAVWGQPNNAERNEFCVGIDNYGWLDATCALLLRFVCFDDSYSGSDRYILINSTATWYGAQNYCRLHHTDLASARNQSELSTIQAKSTTQLVWIGLYRDGWIWLDGKNFSTFPWMPGKPASGFSENCGYLNNSQAASGQCSNILPSVCYSSLIHFVLSVPRKYYLIQQPKTWNDSQVYCRANHEDLAVIESDENVIRFQSDMQKQNFTSSAWIGLYSDNNWRWSLGNETVGSLKLWAAVWGQPNNGNGNEFCVGIDNYGWLDATCALLLRFVCFDDSYSGSDRYILSSFTLSWYNAQSYCRLHHTDLASARNQSEWSTIQAKSNTQFVWIGLYRDGWIWLDGKNFSTFPWMPGKPDVGLSKNCGYLNNSQVASGQCLNILPSVCYSSVVHLIPSVPHKYYLIQEGKTWNDAQAYCRANYDDLAVIKSAENVIEFQSEVQGQNFSSNAWVGMYNDVNSWRWSLGNEPVGLKMWVAVLKQPDNKIPEELCGGINLLGWLDDSCKNVHPFVCFDDRYSGSNSYISLSSEVTWYDAQSYCRQHHTDLASARNQTEQSAIRSKILLFSWIGLFRDGWKWADGTNFSTIPWMSGKPDNVQGGQNCGYLNNGQAVNAPCSNILPFFCHSYSYSGSDRYILINSTATWYGAQSYCRLHHTDLAS
ncbi:secretory phospholipase A2 receptor-like, partial [Silurus meridionalis]